MVVIDMRTGHKPSLHSIVSDWRKYVLAVWKLAFVYGCSVPYVSEIIGWDSDFLLTFDLSTVTVAFHSNSRAISPQDNQVFRLLVR